MQGAADATTVTELELQYSPSRWSRRYANPDAVTQDYEDKCVAGSSSCLEQLKECIKTYDYGVGSNERLVLVSPTSSGIAGCNVLAYLHGGYWSYGSYLHSLHSAGAFTRHGVAYAAIGYDLAPAKTMDGIVDQVKHAVKLLLTVSMHSGAKGLYLVGHSAGAQLAAMMMFVDWDAELGEGSRALTSLLKGLIFISGVYDLVPLLPTYINKPLGMDSVVAQKYSPALLLERGGGAALHACMQRMRVLVVIAENESPAFHQQSRRFYELLRRVVAAAEHVEIKGADHFDIITRLADDDFELSTAICTFVSGWLV